MDNVYILSHHVDYEGSIVEGVAETLILAQMMIEARLSEKALRTVGVWDQRSPVWWELPIDDYNYKWWSIDRRPLAKEVMNESPRAAPG